MNQLGKVPLTVILVLTISSALIFSTSYAHAYMYPKSISKTTLSIQSKAMRCPDGNLAPNNDVSKCPPLTGSANSNNQSPKNPNYKAQANQVIPQVPGNAVVAQQATQAHNTQNSQQATNAHQATQAQQAHENQPSKSSSPTTLKMPNTVKYQAPTLKITPKYPAPKLP